MADHLETLLEQTATLRAPLAGDAPTGADIFLEPEVDPIKTEIDKLTAMSGGDVNWRVVVDASEELLGTRTKDLRLAIWSTAGNAELSGWRGLARGLVVLNALVTEMWDGVFPTRAKTRSNIVQWLSERLLPMLETLPIKLQDGDDVKLVAKLLADVNKTVLDKLGDAFPGIYSFVNTAKRRINDIPVPPPPKVEAAATQVVDDSIPDTPQGPAAAPAPAGGVQLGTAAADAPATTAKIAEALVTLARSMLLADTARAWAYRLHRQGIWAQYEVVSLEAVDGPEASAAALLGELMVAGRWQELVVAGEEASLRAPLWLDPHRYVAHALERMGSAFIDAREVVGRDTAAFAARNAWLLTAKFGNGTAVADADTVTWLRTESRRWRIGARGDEVARSEDFEIAQRFDEAKSLVGAGRHVEGLAIAMQLARRGADTRDRFRASLDVARLAMHAGAHDVARSILEGLVATATAHSLETWDPSLCAGLYAGLYRCLPVDAPDRPKVFEVLCRLDPGAALSAQGAAANGPPARPIPAAGAPPPVAPAALGFAQPAAAPAYAPAPSRSAWDQPPWEDPAATPEPPPGPPPPPPKIVAGTDWIAD